MMGVSTASYYISRSYVPKSISNSQESCRNECSRNVGIVNAAIDGTFAGVHGLCYPVIAALLGLLEQAVASRDRSRHMKDGHAR